MLNSTAIARHRTVATVNQHIATNMIAARLRFTAGDQEYHSRLKISIIIIISASRGGECLAFCRLLYVAWWCQHISSRAVCSQISCWRPRVMRSCSCCYACLAMSGAVHGFPVTGHHRDLGNWVNLLGEGNMKLRKSSHPPRLFFCTRPGFNRTYGKTSKLLESTRKVTIFTKLRILYLQNETYGFEK